VTWVNLFTKFHLFSNLSTLVDVLREMTCENWNDIPYRMENPTKALWALGERGVSLDRSLGEERD
jgi:hypothetical protein